MAEQGPSGVSGQGGQKPPAMTVNDLAYLVSGMSKVDATTIALTKSMKLSSDEEKKLKVTNDLLTASMRKATHETISYKENLEQATKILAASSDISTNSEKELAKTKIRIFQEMEDKINKTGAKGTAEARLFTEKRKALEREYFQDSLKSQVAMAKAQGGVNGALNGMWANTKLKGSQAAEKIGGFMGLAPEAVEMLAGVIGGVLAGVGAFAAVIVRLSTTANNAAKAGYDLGDSWGSAVGMGSKLANEVRNQTGQGLMMSEAKAYELLNQARGEYVLGIQLSDKETKMSTVGFVMGLAKLSTMFGLSAEEGVKLGGSIAVLTKGGMKEATRSFFRIGEEARNLGIPMSALVSIMSEMAEQSYYMGEATEITTNRTMVLIQAIKDLGVKGADGFQNLDGEKIKRISESMVKMISGISDTTAMALNMKPGDSFESVLRAGTKGGYAYKVKAAMNMAKMAEEQGASEYTKALMVGGVLAPGGSIFEKTAKAHEMLDLRKNKGFDESMIAQRMTDTAGADIDRRIDASKTVGMQIAGGADPLAIIASLLTSLVKIAIDLSGAAIFTGKGGAGIADARKALSGGTGAANRYSNPMNRNLSALRSKARG